MTKIISNLSHINNMGVKKISLFEQDVFKIFKIFMRSTGSYCDNEIAFDVELYRKYKDTTSFALTRVSYAFSGLGISLPNIKKKN